MHKHKLTLIGLVLSGSIYLFCIVLELDLFEKSIILLEGLEKFELDEIIIPVFVFFVFLLLNKRRRLKAIKLENEKLKIYKAMLSSSHHILNNFLQQMNLFKITAEETPGFDNEVLLCYEEIIEATVAQIDSLSNLDKIDESTIRTSVMGKDCEI